MGYTKRLIRKSVAAQWVFTLREDVVRSEGCTSRSPVLQALICFFRVNMLTKNPETKWFRDFLWTLEVSCIIGI
jgi:hypothetical protein